MRSRWSAFGSGLIIYLWWYLVLYVVTSRTFAGLPVGLAYGLAAAVVGLIAGAVVGVGARAIELVVEHREVRAGDARDGARLSLGKLPEIVPPRQPGRDGEVPVPMPVTDKPSIKTIAPADSAPATVSPEPVIAEGAEVGPAEPVGEPADVVPAADRLANACEAFTACHGDAVMRGGTGVGTIDRAANLAAFNEFMSVVTALAADGVDVSRVAVSMGTDGVPAAVTFPVSSNDEGVFQ